MPELTDTVTFEVDFNDRTQDGRLLASMRFASGAVRFPQAGERVWAHDAEGSECAGTVYAVDGLIVTITLDRATWTHKRTVIANSFDKIVIGSDQQVTSGTDPDLVPDLVG